METLIFLVRMSLRLINPLKRLHCLVAVFVFISVLRSLMDETVKPLKPFLNEYEAKVLYEGVMPAAHAVTQIMVSSALVAAVGALYETASFSDYTLGRWSADAAVGSYVYTALFTFVTDETNDGPNGDLGAWFAPLFAMFVGTLIIWIRDQSPFEAFEIAPGDSHSERFAWIFLSMLAFTTAVTSFLLRTDAIYHWGYIHAVWGGLLAELLAALVPKKFLRKYDTGTLSMIVGVPLMLSYVYLVINGIDDAVPFMLFVTVIVLKFITSLLREAGGLLYSKTGMPMGKAILGVDVAASLGVISANIFTNFFNCDRLYVVGAGLAMACIHLDPDDLDDPVMDLDGPVPDLAAPALDLAEGDKKLKQLPPEDLSAAREESQLVDTPALDLAEENKKLKQLLRLMSLKDLWAAREESQLVHTLWNACYNKPSAPALDLAEENKKLKQLLSLRSLKDLRAAREESQLVDTLWNACHNKPSAPALDLAEENKKLK